MKSSKETSNKFLNYPYTVPCKDIGIPEQQSVKIPSISFDDWEIIAGYLECPDLIAIANVCVDARRAAQLIFKRKYGSKEITLQIDEDVMKLSFWSKNQRLRRRFDEKKNRSDACLKFIRVFGDGISIFDIELSSQTIQNEIRCRKLIEYLNRFSAESEKTLTVRNYASYLFEEPIQNIRGIDIYEAEYEIYFKAKWNETELDLIINDKREILLRFIRPEMFETMKLCYGPCIFGLIWFLKLFKNLKYLTLIMHEHLRKFIENMPQLETLQICVANLHTSMINKQYKEILLSATAQTNLSILSFNFTEKIDRDNFSHLNFEPWDITRSNNGPDGYRHSIVLTRIPSD